MTFRNVLRDTLLSICRVVGMAAAADAGVKTHMVLASNDGDRLYVMIMRLVTIVIRTMRVEYTQRDLRVFGEIIQGRLF